MMKSIIFAVTAVAFAGCVEDAGTGTGTSERHAPLSCPANKVLICHIPPGNPLNVQEICVGPAAVKAHVVNHGDNVGVCYGACSREGGSCGSDVDCCAGLACPNEETCTSVTPI